MASTIPNERTLRKITLATFLPAFTLLIAAGARAERSYRWRWDPIVIYFGVIPTFLSASTSLLALKTKHDPLAKRASWVTGLWSCNDIFLALFNLGVLIPVWILEPSYQQNNAETMMLETYATVFLLSNMFIHAYLGLYPLKWMLPSWPQKKECPHCHCQIGSRVETVGTKRDGYSLLRAENYLDEPEAEASTGVIRLSTDSEV